MGYLPSYLRVDMLYVTNSVKLGTGVVWLV